MSVDSRIHMAYAPAPFTEPVTPTVKKNCLAEACRALFRKICCGRCCGTSTVASPSRAEGPQHMEMSDTVGTTAALIRTAIPSSSSLSLTSTSTARVTHAALPWHLMTDAAKVKRLRNNLLACARSRKLYEAAVATEHPITGLTGEWRIEFISPDDPEFAGDNAPFEADCNWRTRTIRVSSTKSYREAVIRVIFEMTNAVATPEFVAVEQLGIDEGSICCNTYTKRREKIEHTGGHIVREIIKTGIETGVIDDETGEKIFDSTMNDFETLRIDFDEEWKLTHSGPHAEHIRETHRKSWSSPRRTKVINTLKAFGCSQITIDSFVLSEFATFTAILFTPDGMLKRDGMREFASYFLANPDLFRIERDYPTSFLLT